VRSCFSHGACVRSGLSRLRDLCSYAVRVLQGGVGSAQSLQGVSGTLIAEKVEGSQMAFSMELPGT